MQEYMQNNHALGRSHAPVTVQFVLSYCHCYRRQLMLLGVFRKQNVIVCQLSQLDLI